MNAMTRAPSASRLAPARHVAAALQIAIWRWGVAWPLCVVLALASLALWFTDIRPARTELEAAGARVAQAQHAVSEASTTTTTTDAAPADARAWLPDSTTLTAQLRALVLAAAQHQLMLPAADYQTQRDPATGIVRLTLNASLRADYLQLRGFIESTLREMPNTSIDRLSFRRDNIGQGQIDVQLSVSLWAREAQPPPRVARLEGAGP